MGRCWTWYASIVGSTRPIPLSRGVGVGCISSHATIPYHWAGLLCARKMPLGNDVDHHLRGAECEIRDVIMVPICLLTHKKADVPRWSWAALRFKIPPTSGATSTYGMAVCGNADVGMLRVRRVIAVPAIASAAAGQIQSFQR